jgi:hypothetical protein
MLSHSGQWDRNWPARREEAGEEDIKKGNAPRATPASSRRGKRRKYDANICKRTALRLKISPR